MNYHYYVTPNDKRSKLKQSSNLNIDDKYQIFMMMMTNYTLLPWFTVEIQNNFFNYYKIF